MAHGGASENGYIRLNTLISVGAPVLGALALVMYYFVTLSIAPLEKDIQSNHNDIESIRSQLVPRTEHNRDWAASDREFADMQRQIDENRSDLHGIYGPSDQIKNLSDRIEKIEEESRGAKTLK